MPGAPDLEEAWIRAFLGEDGYLTGKDAETAACDAHVVPVVTGTMDPSVIDQMIDLARTAAEAEAPPRPALAPPLTMPLTKAGAADHAAQEGRRSAALSPQARRALRHAMARLDLDLLSGPAAILRRACSTSPATPPASTPTAPPKPAAPTANRSFTATPRRPRMRLDRTGTDLDRGYRP
jgi:hypothetical protein